MFLKTLSVALLVFGAIATAQTRNQTEPAAPGPAQDTVKPPAINWGKCPQLAPTEEDRLKKGKVLEDCLKEHPVPKNLTEESVDKHQRAIAECALKKEKWFSKSGNYRFSKAETEIKNKKLQKAVEAELVKSHKKCAEEAKQTFAKKDQIIEQVQLYQACMDFHITQTCQIQVTPPQ